MKEYIFFDLDGTLTDSKEGIFNSFKKVFDYFNIELSNEQMQTFIGPPLKESFSKTLKFSEEKTELASKIFHEYYESKGLFENSVYEKIPDLLENLKSCKKRLVVATSKPEILAKKILEHFNLAKYFEQICGSNIDETRSNKSEVIEYALKKCGFSVPLSKENSEKILMVGDRQNDIIGAHKNKIQAVGVLYGYGNFSELQKSNADFIVKSVSELQDFLLKI